MKKYFKKKFLSPSVFVVLLTFAVWHRVLGEALLGEGALYIEERSGSLLGKLGLWGVAMRYDTQAILFFHFLRDVIRDNIFAYMLILLIFMVLVNFSIWLAVSMITRKSLVGIIAVVLFVANYVGSGEFFTSQYYVQFIQRVPNLALTLIGFWFLTKYYQSKRLRDYWTSFFLYSIALILSSNSFMLAPLFFLYPLFSKFTLKNFIYITPFYAVSYLFVGLQSFPSSDYSFFEFLKIRPTILQDIFNKLTILTIPPDVLRRLFSLITKSNFASTFGFHATFPDFVRAVSIIVVAGYAALAIWIVRYQKNLKAFIFTMTFSMPVVLFLAIFIKPSFADELGSSRHLYVASMLVAMFWGIVLYQFFQFGKRARLLTVSFLSIWVLYNNQLIQKDFNFWEERHKTVLATFDYVRGNHLKFPSNSIILMHPYVGYYNSKMLERFYGQRGIRFSYEGMSTEELMKISEEQYTAVIYLRYDGNTVGEELSKELIY